MDYAEIQRRLTGHLAGEASTDFHTQADREGAIKEAYLRISDEWMLWTGQLGTETPADFLSYSREVGKYNKTPPPLVNQNSQPWEGQYPQVHPLISYYAAFRLYQDRGPEMYERSMYWRNLYEEEGKTIQRMLVRNHNRIIQASNADDSTLEGMRSCVRFYLDTSEMTEEQAQRMFPDGMISPSLNRAYREITQEYELSVGTMEVAMLGTDTPGIARRVELPENFIAPMSEAGFTVKGDAIIGASFPYGAQSTYAPSYSIGFDEVGNFLTVQNFPKGGSSLLIRYIAAPAPLVNPADKPWGGSFPTGNKLIILRTMRDMMRGKKELYNLSRFWQNEYDREVMPFKRMLRKYNLGQANRVIMGHAASGGNFGGSFPPINAGEGNKGTENG